MYSTEFFTALATFIIIAVASKQLARYYPGIGLPMITGFLITGMIAGPFVLDLIPSEAIDDLYFINEISLAFIAFAAGTELYLNELRSRFKSIKWMTFGQLTVTFSLGALGIYFLDQYIPFMENMSDEAKLASALLAGTIFVARSPASAMAIIDEMRAKGPFTQTAIGVTVVKDVLVIILFAINFNISLALINGEDFGIGFLMLLLLEIGLSFLSGYLIGKLMAFILGKSINYALKTFIILLIGYGIYLYSHLTRDLSHLYLPFHLYLEPLLMAIIASFYVTNYSGYRLEFQKMLQTVLPFIYVAFFTLTGASALLDVLGQVWVIALLIFGIRLIGMILGSYLGGILAGDPMKYNHLGWMPYVTQAGVGVGLAMVISNEYPEWGPEFATIIIAVIILNQIVGPPLFKWSIKKVGEDHTRAATPAFDGVRDAIIFGLESKSIALGKQLKENGWNVQIASRHATDDEVAQSAVDIIQTNDISLDTMRKLKTENAEAVIAMMDDQDNYKVCELVYENFGTKNLVVRLNERKNFQKFHQLGALIVNPPTAIVSLLDHFVRSPSATSMLLGMDGGQDTIDVEVQNPNLHGLSLRALRLPPEVIILSVSRGGQLLISHGFTRLRLGDTVTLVGDREKLESVMHRFENPVQLSDPGQS
ncbi:MAG: monovalent cation:proton antiporter family protein [Candidatus Cyclobacteriaceae bacterium M3_2C_046]